MYSKMFNISVEEASKLIGYDLSGVQDWYGEKLVCYDFQVSEDGSILEYKYGNEYLEEEHPNEVIQYQVNLVTSEERHSGITPGCFFTEWEELVH